MVQDKNKLKEVGLEPDKPTGHIRAIWALTLILAFAIIVAGGIYFILWYTPWGETTSFHRKGTSDETKDWQTYTNSRYNLTIKYPKDWNYKYFTKNLEGAMFYENTKNISTNTWDSLTIIPGDIALYFNKTETTLNSVLAKFNSESPKCKIEDKKIAGLDGKLLNCPIEEAGEGTTGTRRWYLVENQNVVFELFTADETKKDTLDKMVGTISFSGATASPTASQSNVRYKTYTDGMNRFSFEYPENMYLFPDGFTGESQGGGIIKLLKKDNNNIMSPTKIEVEVHRKLSGTSDIRVAYKEIYNSDLVDDSIRRVAEATVAGVPALKETYTDGEDMGYHFIKGDYLYSISAYTSRVEESVSPLADKDNKTAFDHIVSSWKWL